MQYQRFVMLALVACSSRAPGSAAPPIAPPIVTASARAATPSAPPAPATDAAPAEASPQDDAVPVEEAAAPRFQIVDTTSAPADPAVVTCTGQAPAPGRRIRDVNLCDLLRQDADRKLDPPARYELVSAVYADLRPTWSSHKASLCAGEEAVLVVHRYRPGEDRPDECVQLRCEASFPPEPVRIGKNGELCRSQAGTFEGWVLRPGRVEARYGHGVDGWTLTEVGERYDFQRR